MKTNDKNNRYLLKCHTTLIIIESTIKQAMAAVPDVRGATVNFKIVVLNENKGSMTF